MKQRHNILRQFSRSARNFLAAGLICLFVLAGADSPLPDNEGNIIFIVTTDGKILASRLSDYAGGFIRFRQEDRDWNISPAHVQGIFTKRQEAELFVSTPSLFVRDMVLAIQQAYFSQKPPVDETTSDHFFRYCMSEAETISGAYAVVGADAVEKGLQSIRAHIEGEVASPQHLRRPEEYRPALLFLSLKRIQLGMALAGIRGETGISERLLIRKNAREFVDSFESVLSAARTAEMDVPERERVVRRMGYVKRDWIDPLKHALGGGRMREGRDRPALRRPAERGGANDR